MTIPQDGWFKAAASGGGTSDGCVEVNIGETIYVRDSKDPAGSVLAFNAHEWACFLDGARNGEFNLTAE